MAIKRRIVLLMITLITAGGTYAVCNHQLENQQYIAIDESRAIPMIHFMNIGLTNDGGYSPEDAQAMAELPTKQAKIDYSKEKIQERLKERGVLGYISFLFSKAPQQYRRWDVCVVERRFVHSRRRDSEGQRLYPLAARRLLFIRKSNCRFSFHGTNLVGDLLAYHRFWLETARQVRTDASVEFDRRLPLPAFVRRWA